MARLNILGAQRVKALIEILHEKRDEALAKVAAHLPSEDEIQRKLEQELGVDILRADLDAAVSHAQHVADQINKHTGEGLEVRRTTGYYSSQGTSQSRARDNWQGELNSRRKVAQAPLEKIRKEFKKKEQQLWLCETLEEAKEIVGID